MEAELVDELPSGDGWQYEPKWDGFRGVLENLGGELRALEPQRAAAAALLPGARGARRAPAARLRARRRDRDRRRRAARLRRAAAPAPPGGEPDPEALGGDPGRVHRLRPPRSGRASRSTSCRSRSGASELERKAKRFQLSPATRDRKQAEKWLDRLEAAGLDGVIAKRLGLPYLPGSRDGVVKVKPYQTADCVIVGFRWSEKAEGRISTLLLGLYDDDGELDFVGHCSGFPARGATRARGGAAEAAPEEHGQRQADSRRPEPLVARQGARLEPGAARSSSARCATTSSSATASGTGRGSSASAPDKDPTRLHLARGQAPAPRERPDRAEAPRWSLTHAARSALRASTRSRVGRLEVELLEARDQAALRRHMPAVRSPTFVDAACASSSSVNLAGSQRATSSQRSGAETRASGVGRIE